MAAPMHPDVLVDVLRDGGLTVHEYTGWRDRCRCHTGSHEKNVGWIGDTAERKWGDVNGVVVHITAGNLGTRTVEQYIASAINGDPETPCKVQIVTDPNGGVWLNSAGRANHAGKVGSRVRDHLRAADFALDDPYDDRFRGGDVDGNAFTYGIENIAATKMTAAQRDASVKICAAIARHYGWSGQESVGHGEISSARYPADPNLDMGQFRRDVMKQVAGTTPAPEPTPEPEPEGLVVSSITANLAGYDSVGKGMRTRVARAKADIPNYLLPKAPTWFHFQECAIDMWPELDKKLAGYTRVPAGGKGRESYYRKDAGITIIEATLTNVETMLDGDTKEILTIAWEKDGFRAVDVNFHSENQGTAVQPAQLKEAMNAGRKMCIEHDIPQANLLVTGDSNFTGAADLAVDIGWTEAIHHAGKKIDLKYKSTNRWSPTPVLGKRIDVAVTRTVADVREAEILFGAVIADHWPLRILRRLIK